MMRIINKPAITLEEWALNKGIPKTDLPTDRDFAEVIGGIFAERTRHGRGKLKEPMRKVALQRKLSREFKQEIEEGKIPMTRIEIPLNPNNEADRAYVRAMARRQAAREAMSI